MDIQKIISKLQDKGITQQKIAEYVGCTQSNISHFLRGKHGFVRPSSRVVDGLRKLIKKHGITEK